MDMPIATTFSIEGHRIKKYKGVVRGIIVRSPTIVQGIILGDRVFIDLRVQGNGVAPR